MVDLKGTTLGKYRIIERLGRGGMAEVYKAYHPQLDRYVAIKILHGYLAEGEDFTARFNREAKAVANLRHENIVQVFDFDIESEIPYMVMEFIEGETLKARVNNLNKNKKQMSFKEIIDIFRQVASALAYAHKKGLLHRDIKPSNVLVEESGKTYLTDFGVARIVSDTQFTASGALLGTPAYMAPEQALGQDLTATCDIYALGIVLYEMITGQVPFDSDTPMAVIQKHISAPLPFPGALRPDIPMSLERVILKSLAKDPEDRFQSVAEMLKETEKAIEEVSAIGDTIQEVAQKKKIKKIAEQKTEVKLKEEPATESVDPDAETLDLPTTEETDAVAVPSPKEDRSEFWLWAALVTVIALILGFAAIYFGTDLIRDNKRNEVSTPAIVFEEPTDIPDEESPPEEVAMASPLIQLRIVTTSDWTAVRLDEGGIIKGFDIVSISDGVTFDFVDERMFNIVQECETESECQEIEVIIDVQLDEVNPKSKLVFFIEKGSWGWTQTEVMNYMGEHPITVKTTKYDSHFGDGTTIEVPANMMVKAMEATIKLGAEEEAHYLSLTPSEGDGLHELITLEGIEAQTTIHEEGSSAAFLYFQVDDEFIFGGPQKIQITVEYYDNGYEPIVLDYDSSGETSIYRDITLIKRTNTETWKTVSVVITDAGFTNRQNFDSDFRFSTGSTPLIIKSVTITLIP